MIELRHTEGHVPSAPAQAPYPFVRDLLRLGRRLCLPFLQHGLHLPRQRDKILVGPQRSLWMSKKQEEQ